MHKDHCANAKDDPSLRSIPHMYFHHALEKGIVGTPLIGFEMLDGVTCQNDGCKSYMPTACAHDQD